jgi:hypothetical protein
MEIRYLNDLLKLMDENWMKDPKISHCNKCHHEAYTILGTKCSWCGGAMIEENKHV